MTYTEQEIQKRGEIFIKEIRMFGMTFRFYVYKDFCGATTQTSFSINTTSTLKRMKKLTFTSLMY